MQRALVEVDETEWHRTVLREAADLAAGVNAELVVFKQINKERFDEQIETLSQIGNAENKNYGLEPVFESERESVRELVDEEIGSVDVDVDIQVAVVDDPPSADPVLELIQQEDCDHAFISGLKQSPTGKALFGNYAQRVILNADCYVTIQMRE